MTMASESGPQNALLALQMGGMPNFLDSKVISPKLQKILMPIVTFEKKRMLEKRAEQIRLEEEMKGPPKMNETPPPTLGEELQQLQRRLLSRMPTAMNLHKRGMVQNHTAIESAETPKEKRTARVMYLPIVNQISPSRRRYNSPRLKLPRITLPEEAAYYARHQRQLYNGQDHMRLVRNTRFQPPKVETSRPMLRGEHSFRAHEYVPLEHVKRFNNGKITIPSDLRMCHSRPHAPEMCSPLSFGSSIDSSATANFRSPLVHPAGHVTVNHGHVPPSHGHVPPSHGHVPPSPAGHVPVNPAGHIWAGKDAAMEEHGRSHPGEDSMSGYVMHNSIGGYPHDTNNGTARADANMSRTRSGSGKLLHAHLQSTGHVMREEQSGHVTGMDESFTPMMTYGHAPHTSPQL